MLQFSKGAGMIPAQPKPSDSGYLSLFQEVTRLITSTLNVDKVLETIAAKIKNKQLEITISPVSVFDSDGKTDFVIGTIQDITAHIRLQEEQRIRERLQGVLEMSGAAVHELNTPIFAALGTAQMLLKDLAPTDDHCVSGVIVRTSGVMISPTRIDLAFRQAISTNPPTSTSSIMPQTWICFGRIKRRMSYMDSIPIKRLSSPVTIMPNTFCCSS